MRFATDGRTEGYAGRLWVGWRTGGVLRGMGRGMED